MQFNELFLMFNNPSKLLFLIYCLFIHFDSTTNFAKFIRNFLTVKIGSILILKKSKKTLSVY